MMTFKTFAMAMMMAVFGVTASFANNNNNKGYNNKPAVHNNQNVHGNAAYHGTYNGKVTRPNEVKGCNCKTCQNIRYQKEMERLHKVTEGAVKGCKCKKCEDYRYMMTHKGNAHNPVQKRNTSYRH